MDKYEVLEQVGKGSFGAVTKIRRKADKKILVWKEICYGRMKEKEKQQLVSEVNILREFRHPHIVKYYDRIVDKPNSKIFIVMEYCEKGDLGHLIKKYKRDNEFMSEDLIWKIFMQILIALQACHNRENGKILHRDIKPGNVLMDGGLNAKLADFGLSRIMGENSIYAETKVGTPYYMSPEQIADLRYNEKSDIWSAGCLLYEMTALRPPFQAKSHAELAAKINKGHVDKIPAKYSDDLQRVISWMMSLDPNQRPSVTEILSLPQITIKNKEKVARDEIAKLKDYENKLKEREEKVRREKEELRRREEDILRREKKVRETEKQKDLNKTKDPERPKTLCENREFLINNEEEAKKQQTPTQSPLWDKLGPKDKEKLTPKNQTIEKIEQLKERLRRENSNEKYQGKNINKILPGGNDNEHKQEEKDQNKNAMLRDKDKEICRERLEKLQRERENSQERLELLRKLQKDNLRDQENYIRHVQKENLQERAPSIEKIINKDCIQNNSPIIPIHKTERPNSRERTPETNYTKDLTRDKTLPEKPSTNVRDRYNFETYMGKNTPQYKPLEKNDTYSKNIINLIPVEDPKQKNLERPALYPNAGNRKSPNTTADKENIVERAKDSPVIPKRILKAERVFENIGQDLKARRDNSAPKGLDRYKGNNQTDGRSPDAYDKISPNRANAGRNATDGQRNRTPPAPGKNPTPRPNVFAKPVDHKFVDRYSPDPPLRDNYKDIRALYRNADNFKDIQRDYRAYEVKDQKRPATANVIGRKEDIYRGYAQGNGLYDKKDAAMGVQKRCTSAERKYSPLERESPEIYCRKDIYDRPARGINYYSPQLYQHYNPYANRIR